jgi:predicted transcriptional regulator
MFKKRNTLEIMADILKTSREGANKTKIVYSTRMNFKQATTYLNKLEQLGLIAREDKIRTTERGYEYLKLYDQIVQVI